MKKTTVLVFVSIIVLYVTAVVCLVFLRKDEWNNLDAVEVNELIHECSNNWNTLRDDTAVFTESRYSFDYAVIDVDENVLKYTREDGCTTIVSATGERDTIRDIVVDGRRVGYLIIYNDISEYNRITGKRYATIFICCSAGGLMLLLFFLAAIYYRIIKPFDRMKDFAGSIAAGNLDVPLEMDRNNTFGAFTESFDIMREELAVSREREYAAQQSKQEMVAQLSHDIKTPVASIKAMAELLTVQATDEKWLKKLKAIVAKADQIDSLITNLFQATMEDMERMEVELTEEGSTLLYQMIREADYKDRIENFDMAECLVVCDKLRIGQVFNNIIYNSYKYADTKIHITSEISGRFLMIRFTDEGGGVEERELSTITELYKRGSNASGKKGSGLGLYIAKNLMENMNGGMECSNADGGFCVAIYLRLA